jgi:cytochrome c1
MYEKVKAIIMSFDPLKDDPLPFVITRAEVDDMAEQITALLYSVGEPANVTADNG